jgi:hypothetical protein
MKLAMVISENLDLAIEYVFYWTDRITILKYITNTSARFYTFVAIWNIVLLGKLKELTSF